MPESAFSSSPDMWPAEPLPAGGVIEFVRVLFSVSDQVFDVLDTGFFRELGCNDKNVRSLCDQSDRSEVLNRVVWKLTEEIRVHRVCSQGAHDNGLAVRSLFGDIVNTDVAAGTRLVFNNNISEIGAGFFCNSSAVTSSGPPGG